MTAPVTSPANLPGGGRRTAGVVVPVAPIRPDVAVPAPVLVTADGTRWTLRARTAGGEGLYAPETVRDCPRMVMATASELAEHGVSVALAEALPVLSAQERAARVLPLLLAEARTAGLPPVSWDVPRRGGALLGGAEPGDMGAWTAFLLETGEGVAQRMSDGASRVRHEVTATWRGVRLELSAFAPAGSAVAS